MSITKTYINGDITTLYNWLVANGSDFFTSFVNNTTYISCYVGEFEFMKIGVQMGLSGTDGVTIYTNGGSSIHIAGYSSQFPLIWAYKTSTSLVFSAIEGYDGEEDGLFSIIVTKDNNNDVSAVIVNSFVPNLSADNTIYAVSISSELIDTTVLRPNIGKYTTAFCPLLVSGTSYRYLPNVYYMPLAQYSIEGSFLIDNVVYLCNGIIAVKDEYRG